MLRWLKRPKGWLPGLVSMHIGTAFCGRKKRDAAPRDRPADHEERAEEFGRGPPSLRIFRPDHGKRAGNKDNSAKASPVNHEPRTLHGQPVFQ
jgi:hypothetical protein